MVAWSAILHCLIVSQQYVYYFYCTIVYIDAIAVPIMTSKIWVDCLIMPVFTIIMVSACSHGKQHDPFGFFCCGTLSLRKVHINGEYADDVRLQFMKGQHTMHHNACLFNGTRIDMAIETTFMRYGHD